jgi:two-component system NtrC family sensor kinase
LSSPSRPAPQATPRTASGDPPQAAAPATRWLGIPDAEGLLRLLLVATILVPLSLAPVAAYLSYLNSYANATASASQAVAVATENTTKVLDTHLLVAARINDLLGAMNDAQIGAAEKPLHEQIASQIEKLPEVAAAWVIDARGHELVSARVYPVNRALDHSTREDFAAFYKADIQSYVWMLRARSLDTGDYKPYFTVSLRRNDADGHFNGVVVVAVSGAYFGSFYNALLAGAEHYTASVIRDDGTVLAQFPQPSGAAAPAEPDPLLARAIAGETRAGVDAEGTPFDGGRVVAISRVGAYPIYVTIERSKASIFANWERAVRGYLLLGVPGECALVGLTLLALYRTRRERIARAQASDDAARRAALELELHRAQRLEAVGMLTAGIAHDFNNLLMIATGNIERLEDRLDPHDERRKKIAAGALGACARAAALSKRVLGLARREPARPVPAEINEIIVNALELPWKSGDRIAAEFRLSDGLWVASVDADQLATALLNLAFNARDAMPDGGRLTVETHNIVLDDAAAVGVEVAPGEYITIAVRDTGQGMPEEVRAKALDPFFTTKEPGKGTGLGLSLVNAFAARSGGVCKIDSAPGHGTTVTIYLPRHQDAEAAPANGDDGPALTAAGTAS